MTLEFDIVAPQLPINYWVGTGVIPSEPPPTDQRIIHREMLEQIAAALHSLAPKEALVVQMRFGLGGHNETSLADVGAVVGLSKERVRQIEAKALRKLRHPSRSKPLRPFWPQSAADLRSIAERDRLACEHRWKLQDEARDTQRQTFDEASAERMLQWVLDARAQRQQTNELATRMKRDLITRIMVLIARRYGNS